MLKRAGVAEAVAHGDDTIDGLQTCAISIMFGLACLSLVALPYEVSVLSNAYAFGPSIAGWIGSGEILALAVTASWIGRTIARRDKRALTVAGVVIAGAASLVCILTDNMPLLIACRLAFGVGLGMITAAVTALPVLHPAPERLFAYMQLASGLIFVPLMFVTPLALEQFARTGLFMCELGFIALLGPLSSFLPRARHGEEATSTAPLTMRAVRVLASLTLMYMASAAATAYSVQAGTRSGLSDFGIGWVFTIAALISLGGAVLAAILGVRRGYAVPIVAGFIAQASAAAFIYIFASQATFAAGVVAIYVGGYFTTPYLQGLLAEMDSTGRVSSLGGAAINYGVVCGPAIAALFAGLPNAEPMIGMLSIGIFIAGLAALWSVTSHPTVEPQA